MHKLFTSLLLVLLVGACGSMPVPRVDRGSDTVDGDAVLRQPIEAQTDSTQPVVVVAPNVKVDDRTSALFTQALEAMATSKDTVASALLLEITERQPELAGPWVNLSILAEKQGDAEVARRYLDIALEKNPNNCDALVRLGVAHRVEGEFSDAEASYQRCLEANPSHSHANLNLGILYELYMGKYPEALALYHEYQLAIAEPDPKVNIWISDLERRVAALAAR